MEKTGVLLVNLGSPKSPSPGDVGKFLREFLMDKHVIDIPFLSRWFLVNVVISPLRKFRSAKAYSRIWNKVGAGSPLVAYTRDLSEQLKNEVSENWPVAWAMRYGEPSITENLRRLAEQKVSRLLVVPLYPQEAASSSGTVREVVAKWAEKSTIPVYVTEPFFAAKEFLHAQAEVVRKQIGSDYQGAVVFSFHGLPERHVRKADVTNSGCLSHKNCCEPLTSRNSHCYRAQCMYTAKQVAELAGLKPGSWRAGFQSGLGKDPWLEPKTTDMIKELYTQGYKDIAVSCPSFVADCLETIDEIGNELRHEFLQMGGRSLRLITALNVEPVWVKALGEGVRQWPAQKMN